LRLGRWYDIRWANAKYGEDAKNNKLTPESAGFGLTDKAWQPFVHANRSFGIRTAHD
jgi:hypothetical protein